MSKADPPPSAVVTRIVLSEEDVGDHRETCPPLRDEELPLLTATVRAMTDADSGSIEELPPACRAFRDQVEAIDKRLDELEHRFEQLGDVRTGPTTKAQKLVGVLAYGENKRRSPQ